MTVVETSGPSPYVEDEERDTFDPDSVAWVLSPADLAHCVEAISTAVEVVLDLETTGLDEHATRGGATNGGYPAQVVLASLTLPQDDDPDPLRPTTWVVPLAHPESPWLGQHRKVLTRIAATVHDEDRPMIGQHIKFDSRWTHAHTGPRGEHGHGVDLSSRIVWDTKVSSHLLDENSPTALKARAPATFGIRRWDDFDLSTPGAAQRVPLIDLGLYAARDTYWTWRLATVHRQAMLVHPTTRGIEPETPDEVEVAKLGRLATWVSMPTAATLARIEQRGILLDREWTTEQLAQYRAKADALTEQLAARYPSPDLDVADASFAPTSRWFMAWADLAVQAGDLRIAELTGQGRPRWTKGVLIRQARAGSDVALTLLEHRQASKRAEFLTSWLGYQAPDGAVHATYNDGSVVTGRLSSSGPNMQQVTKALRPAYIPRPGYLLADLDYGQIEMRAAAFISRCAPMLEAFQRGDDLHSLLALRIITAREASVAHRGGRTPRPLTLADVTPEERQKGKSANFGLLYAMSPEGFREYAEVAYGVSMSFEEALQTHRAFFDTWTGLHDWHVRAVHRAARTGQVVSPLGRVRRVPDIRSQNDYLAQRAERMAINSPVQGFASDLMQMAAASIEGLLPGTRGVPGARIVATVHDSIVVEVPRATWEEIVRDCIGRMEGIGRHLRPLDCDLDVPLVADASVGTRWGLGDVWKS